MARDHDKRQRNGCRPLSYSWLLLLLLTQGVQAQIRGPLTIHFVNDSKSKVDIIWTNHLKMIDGELVAVQTGPLPPSSKQTYRSYVYDVIDLRQVDEECVQQSQCKSVTFRVLPASNQDVQSNVFIVSPDFQGTTTTSEAAVRSLFGESIPARMRILNHSGGDVRLFWVNPAVGAGPALVSMSDTAIHDNSGGSSGNAPYFSANVFHQFQIQQESGDGSIQKTVNFRVIDKDIDVTVSSEFSVVVDLSKPDYKVDSSSDDDEDDSNQFEYQQGVDLFEQCQQSILSESASEPPDIISNEIENCVKENYDKVDGVNAGDDNATQNVQSYITDKMENYVCSDSRMETSEPIETRYWTSQQDQLSRFALIMHQDEKSSVHLIPKFVSPEECKAIEAQAEPYFEATTSTDAIQGIIAPVSIPWEKENTSDPIARTGRRIFDYAQHVLPKMNIHHEGQEPLLATHYFGRGREDLHPDQYKAHCDTDCSGKSIRGGQRVATMILYCATPEEGGHTNFRNAQVHIDPEPGMALFITYINDQQQLVDDGMSLHTGCPVYEGAKKIVTQWIRHDVDKDHPHDQFSL